MKLTKSSRACECKQGVCVNCGECARCSYACASLRRRSTRSNALEIRAYDDIGSETEDEVEVEVEDINENSRNKCLPRERRKVMKLTKHATHR